MAEFLAIFSLFSSF